jgi:hypothetical protein
MGFSLKGFAFCCMLISLGIGFIALNYFKIPNNLIISHLIFGAVCGVITLVLSKK